MANPEMIVLVKKEAKEIASTDLKVALRPELGPVGFSEFHAELTPLVELCGRIADADLTMVPNSTMMTIQTQLNIINQSLQHMKEFILSGSIPPANQRQQLIKPIHDQLDNTVNALMAILAFGMHNQAAGLLSKIEGEIAGTRTDLQNANKEATTILESIRKAAGATGVGAQSNKFAERAQDHASAARGWLWAIVGFGVVAAGYALLLAIAPGWIVPTDTSGKSHLIVAFAGRALLISLLLWVVAWSARQYRAHRHNEVINVHRETALNTFESFISAADKDPDTKNAVILQTTQSIFAGLPTGYLSEEPEPAPHTAIVEVVRGVRGHKD